MRKLSREDAVETFLKFKEGVLAIIPEENEINNAKVVFKQKDERLKTEPTIKQLMGNSSLNLSVQKEEELIDTKAYLYSLWENHKDKTLPGDVTNLRLKARELIHKNDLNQLHLLWVQEDIRPYVAIELFNYIKEEVEKKVITKQKLDTFDTHSQPERFIPTFDLDNPIAEEVELLHEYQNECSACAKNIPLEECVKRTDEAERIVKKGQEAIVCAWTENIEIRPCIADIILKTINKRN